MNPWENRDNFKILSVGHKKLGECFIKNNINKDATNEENQTPLHYAVKYGQIEFAEMLINNGAKTDVADENRNTPLHLAVGEGITFLLFSSSLFFSRLDPIDSISPIL